MTAINKMDGCWRTRRMEIWDRVISEILFSARYKMKKWDNTEQSKPLGIKGKIFLRIPDQMSANMCCCVLACIVWGNQKRQNGKKDGRPSSLSDGRHTCTTVWKQQPFFTNFRPLTWSSDVHGYMVTQQTGTRESKLCWPMRRYCIYIPDTIMTVNHTWAFG